jgi:uncharacterized repeat protein (TIGR04076 family)
MKLPVGDQVVILQSICSSCLFHRKAGEAIPISKLTPQGMCADAFHAGYPFFLSLMYDGLKPQSRAGVCFRCSCSKCQAIWLIRSVPHWFAPLLKLAETVFHALGRSFDFPDRIMLLKLISLEGDCSAGHRVGSEYKSDLASLMVRKGDFCPQSFYTLYPFLASGGGFLKTPWKDPDTKGTVVCPASIQAATYILNSPGKTS